MGNIVHLSTPLTAEDVQALELDDIVYLSGEVYTMMYPSHFTRLMDMMRKGEPLPMELAGRAIYNTGTIFCRDEQGRCDLRAIGTTTSSKFNAYTPDFIRLSSEPSDILPSRADPLRKQWGRDWRQIHPSCRSV